MVFRKVFFLVFFLSNEVFSGAYCESDCAATFPEERECKESCYCDLSKLEEGLARVTLKVEGDLKVVDEKVKAIEDKKLWIDSILDANDKILTIISWFLGGGIIFTVGATAHAVIDAKKIREENDRELVKAREEHSARLSAIETEREKVVSDLKAELDAEILLVRNSRDFYTRFNRLTAMIAIGSYDSDVFFSNLTQLYQQDNPEVLDLVNLIRKYSSHFDEDVNDLLNDIDEKFLT